MWESLQRVRALIWLQWRPTLHMLPGGNRERTLFWWLLVPMMAFGAFVFGVCGYCMASPVVQDPKYLSLILMGFGGLILGTFLLLAFFDQTPLSGLDANTLFHLPIRPGEILASQTIGNALNPMFLFAPLGFSFGCAAAAMSKGHLLLAVNCLLSLPLWLIQFSVIVMVADMMLVRLRRSKALSQIALLVSLAMVLSVALAILLLSRDTAENPEDSTLWQTIAWLWERASPFLAGLPGLSPLGWVSLAPGWPCILTASFLEVGILYALGTCMLGRLMSEGAGEAIQPRKSTRASRAARKASLLEVLPIWPFFIKDLRLLWRERAVKVVLSAVTILLLALPAIVQGFLEEQGASWTEGMASLLHWLGPLVTVGLLNTLIINQLGLEGSGILLFFASPSPRWRFLAGKNLALFSFAMIPLGVYEGMLLVQGSSWPDALSDCLFALCVALVFFGAGNFASILWPRALSVSGRTTAAGIPLSQRLITVFFQSLVQVASFYLTIPLISGRYALFHCEKGWVFAALIVAMLSYGIITYALALAFAGRLLIRLESRVFERLAFPRQTSYGL
jgi:hypothetical protein